MSLTVKYVDIPDGVQENAVISVNQESAFPSFDAQELTAGADGTAYATLETDGWPLDGSRQIIADENESVGWWSRMVSDSSIGLLFVYDEETGEYTKYPSITVSLPELYSASGISVTFWPSMGHWCSEMLVEWYNGEDRIDGAMCKPDSPEFFLEKYVDGFDKIVVTLSQTNLPSCRAKIQKIQIGQEIVFTNELTRVSLLNEIDASLCDLSADTMTIEIKDKKNRNLLPQKNQEMQLFRNGERIASHYIYESSRLSAGSYIFQCQSAVGRLEDDFLGGIYEHYPIESLLTEVLDGFPFSLDSTFSGLTVTGYLPVCMRREALQQISFAIGAVVTTQGDGHIRLVPLPDATSDFISAENILAGAKVSRTPAISTIQVVAHKYTKQYSDQVETLLDEAQVYGTDGFFVFDEPHHSYKVSYGFIVDSGVNWVRLQTNAIYPNVTLTAKRYGHTMAVHTYKNAQAKASERGNALSIDSATLVNDENVAQVLERLVAYSKNNILLTQDIVAGEQKAGQIVESLTPWNTPVTGHITSMESEFTRNGHTAHITIRGKEG